MNKKHTKQEKRDAFIGSWFTALIYGGILVIIAGLLTWPLTGLLGEDIKNASMYFLIPLLLIFLSWLAFIPLTRYHFGKYFQIALLVGFIFTSCIGLVALGSKFASTTGNICSIENQLESAQNSIYPIATDLGAGTAFAVDNKGTLLTVYHVVEGAQRVYVNYVNEEIPVTIIDTAPEYDLALLKIDRLTEYFLDLTSDYKVSDQLYSLGYPGNTFNAGQASLSGGILSRILENSDLKLNDASSPNGLEVIQTDAALNPGNSGGPIFNECGVIGVVDAKSDSNQLQEYGISSEEGISFGISSKSAASRFSLPIHFQE